MSQTSVDFLNLFVRSPGELLYFFTVIAVSLASLFMVLGQRLRRPDDLAARRYTLTLIGIVLAWLTLMIGALMALLSDREAVTVLPPLERFATVITIVLLTWVFLVGEHRIIRQTPNVLLVLAIALTVVGYVFTALQWADLAGDIDFNLSALGATWTFVAAALSLLGILLIIGTFSRVVDAPLKLVFFAIILVGHAGTLLQIAQGNIIGDYAGPVRMSFIVALTVVPALVYRSIVDRLEAEAIRASATLSQRVMSAQQPPAVREMEARPTPVDRESVQLLRALGMMLEEATAQSVPERVVKAVIEVLKVDVAALLRMKDANYADVDVAYDNVLERSVDGIAVNLDNQPTLVNAIERREQRQLYGESNSEELQDLYTRLDIEQTGPVYIQPLTHESDLVAILLVALPYTKRELSQSDVGLLKGLAVIAGSLLALSYTADDARLMAEERAIQAMIHGVMPDEIEDDEVLAARQELQASLQLARDQIAQLSKQVVELKIQLDDERSQVASDLEDTEEGMSISQELIALSEEQERLREERDALAQRLQEAEAAVQGAVATSDEALYQEMINSLQREKDDLVTQRERLQQELDDLRARDRVILPQDFQQVLDRMTAEKNRLQEERDQFSAKLVDLQSQLETLGIEEGPAGLTQLINQLNEQRAVLQTENTKLQKERDRLLDERAQLADRIQHEAEREERMKSLEVEVQHLAGDREAAAKQRDQLRLERDELVHKLDVVKEHRARLLAQNSGYEIELREAHGEQTQLREQIERLSNERSDLLNERDRLLAEKRAVETERDQLVARRAGDPDRLTRLEHDGVGALTAMIEKLTSQRRQLEHELNEARTRLAIVENELEALRVRAGREDGDVQYEPENADMMVGLIQELRTPMTSVTGYVDLLLGESAGILGEMQRKFLQRVSTNVSRLASMIDDLVHIAELDTGRFTMEPAPANVVNMIEDAITNASVQFREKGLAVNLDLEEDLPLVYGDPDALNQIVNQLLTNAYLVSPPDTEIFVTARREETPLKQGNGEEKPVDCLFVSVEDRGGGISEEDEQRVFARKYKADNPLIQGLGDTGVGMSLAKALVEAHGGRLWLEIKENVGSVFCFVVPLNPAPEHEGLSDAS